VTHNVSMHSRQTSRGVQLMFSVFFLIFFILKSRQKLANSVEYNYNMVCVCVCVSVRLLLIFSFTSHVLGTVLVSVCPSRS
jgi:hypothetical protein